MRAYVPIAIATFVALAGCSAETVEQKPAIVQLPSQPMSTVIIAPRAPPPARVEIVPPPPQTAAVDIWRPGHWDWNGSDWDWIPGAYIARPRPAVEWHPGHWLQETNGWAWQDGYWD